MNTSENDGLVVLAVDDEEPALMELAYLLEQDQRVGTVLRASDSISALRILTGGDQVNLGGFAGGTPPTGLPAPAKQSDVDVLFLDIRMPGLDGLELANVLSRYVIPPSVVFVTAHDDRAVEAFDVGAVDYLLKPLRPERLYASLTRILSSRGTTVPVEPASDEEGDDEVIPVSSPAPPSWSSAPPCGGWRPRATTPGCTPPRAATWCASRSRCSRSAGPTPGSCASTGPTSSRCP